MLKYVTLEMDLNETLPLTIQVQKSCYTVNLKHCKGFGTLQSLQHNTTKSTNPDDCVSLSSCLPRLRPSDGHVPPSEELHFEPRGWFLFCLCGGTRDRTRVSYFVIMMSSRAMLSGYSKRQQSSHL